MASIEKRVSRTGDVTYRARVKQTGHPRPQRHLPAAADARRWVTEQERLIRDGRYFERVESSRHTLAEPIEKYVNQVSRVDFYGWKFHGHYLHWFKSQIGHTMQMLRRLRTLLTGPRARWWSR